MRKNLIINLPTGCGKNFIIANSLKPEKFSYLILVPRIILLEQIEIEILKFNKDYEEYIQRIGDGNNKYNSKKKITICVYNSVKVIDGDIRDFDYIIVDEAHHVVIPEIYKIDEDDYIEDDEEDEGDNESDDESDDESDNESDDGEDDDEDEEDEDDESDFFYFLILTF